MKNIYIANGHCKCKGVFLLNKFKGLNICCFHSMIQGHTSNKTSYTPSPKITAIACCHPLVICFVCWPMIAFCRFDCGVRQYKNHPILLIVKYLDNKRCHREIIWWGRGEKVSGILHCELEDNCDAVMAHKAMRCRCQRPSCV